MKLFSVFLAISTTILPSGARSSILTRAVPCSSLAASAAATLATQKCTVVSATLVAASGSMPQYCKVVAKVTYGNSDQLNFQVYLPATAAWTGRFMAVGNGGMAGTIDTSSMASQLALGFAVAGGDAGHLAAVNNGGSGAPDTNLPYLHDSDQVQAWIHNAISLFTPSAKTLVRAFYGKEASYSYYNGCSTGGAQGFALAQYHPYLFDGIYAGSPGNYYSHLALSFLWNAEKTQGAALIPQVKLSAITAAVLDKCDTLDGVADKMLENPLECHFDIDTLSCAHSKTATCLTIEQLTAAKQIYGGPTSSINGASLYPGFSVGSEAAWSLQEGPLASAFSIPILQNLVFGNLSYDALAFNWGSDVATLDANAGRYIDEIGPDFSSFKASGGKMLVTQGWSDAFNAATWPIKQLERMEKYMGGYDGVSQFFKLFMVPGGGHCGPDATNYPNSPGTYHANDPLIAWVERGMKPATVLATGTYGNGGGAPISRLLCPWPETAVYKQGSTNSSTSYECSL